MDQNELKNIVQCVQKTVDFRSGGIVGEAQPKNPATGVHAHRLKRAHRIEVATARHDPARGKLRGKVFGIPPRIQRDGRRARLGPVRAEKPHPVAPLQSVEQGLQKRGFLRAHQIVHKGTARNGGGIRRPAVMGVQRIDIIRHARAGSDLRMVRPCRGKPFVKATFIEIMA